ncbi:MAG: methyltransferase domain-containing protein [Planctomycetota bacterium]
MGSRGPDRYRLAAPIYDLATALWSGGAIWRTRARALTLVAPGARVLVPGAWTGRTAVEAARRGARVVVAERSEAMAGRARRRIAATPGVGSRPAGEGGGIDLVVADVRDLEPDLAFDAVLAEHFLNVFEPDEMRSMREHLVARTRPGGMFAVADFAPVDPGAPLPLRAAQRLHHVLPLGGCALLTGNAMHPIYDHGAELAQRSDLRLESALDARSFGVGPRWFRSWIFRRIDAPSP